MESDKIITPELYWSLHHEKDELQKDYDELSEKYKELSEKEHLFRVDSEQCKGIKKNGSRCRQAGLPDQSGGHIINGFCEYHR